MGQTEIEAGRAIWVYNFPVGLPVVWSIREVVMPDPTWQALYRAALVETDPIKLNGRIEAARQSIRQRLEQIEDSDTRERQQLNDALGALEDDQVKPGEWYLSAQCKSCKKAIPIIACPAPPAPAVSGKADFTFSAVSCFFCEAKHDYSIREMTRFRYNRRCQTNAGRSSTA